MSLPLATLIMARLSELDINLHGLAARLGYSNTNKGSRRLQAMIDGRLIDQDDLLSRLPAALEVSSEEVELAVRAHWELKERAYRDAFVPHAVILTERRVPSQIIFCAITGSGSALRIALDATRPRASYARQAQTEVIRRTDGGQREIPFFGQVRGFAVNYEWRRAARFDLDGRVLAILPHAVRSGSSEWAT